MLTRLQDITAARRIVVADLPLQRRAQHGVEMLGIGVDRAHGRREEARHEALQLLVGVRFGKEAVSPGIQPLQDNEGVFEARHHGHRSGVVLGAQAPREVEAVHLRHQDVGDQELRRLLPGRFQRFQA